MKRTLKYSLVLAGALIAMTGTAFACINNSDCSGGQVCAAPPWDYTRTLPKTCQERQSIFASWGSSLLNAITNIIMPIGPITRPIMRPVATVIAPNPTLTHDTLARLMESARRNAAPQATTPLIDENGDEYTCVPESNDKVGLDCAAPKEEAWKEDAMGRKYTVCEEPKEERGGGNNLCARHYKCDEETDACVNSCGLSNRKCIDRCFEEKEEKKKAGRCEPDTNKDEECLRRAGPLG